MLTTFFPRTISKASKSETEIAIDYHVFELVLNATLTVHDALERLSLRYLGARSQGKIRCT